MEPHLKAGEDLGQKVQKANDAVHEGHRHFDEERLPLSQLKQVLSLLQS